MWSDNLPNTYDWVNRVVSVTNLEEMCKNESGMCHRYWIVPRKHTCQLWYSNPDEYAQDHPVCVVLPMFDGKVVFYIQDTIRHGEDPSWVWQAFDCIFNAEKVWWNPKTNSFITDASEAYRVSTECS